MNKFYKKVRLFALFTLIGTAWSAKAQFPAPYCPAAFASGIEPITLVNFAGINNTSPAATGGAAHQDFTAIQGQVTPTSSYPITIKGNTDGDFTAYLNVFFDWNHDNDFADAGESYNIGTITNSTGVDAIQLTGSITIPVDALQGVTRMRVVKRYNTYGTVCNTAGYGQAEDYTVLVSAAPACVYPSGVALNGAATTTTATVAWTPPASAPTGYEYIYSTTNTTPASTATGTQTTATNAPLTSLNPTTTYYFWVRSVCGGSVSEWSPVFSFATLPGNDDCANALALTVNSSLTCSVTTNGTTLGATNSMAAAPCSGNPDDDVWFSFVATSTQHKITLSNVTAVSGTSTDMYFQVLSGACGSQTSVLCSDPNENTATGLTPGQTYYVRVYSYAATSRQNFTICIGTPPPPPANDSCEGAVALTVNPNYACGVTTAATTVSATNSMAAAPCSGTPDDDVWFSFVATGTSHRISLTGITAVEGTSTDMYFQVLEGSCGSLTSLLCSDAETNDYNTFVPGQTYYVRAYSYGTTSRQNFNICVGTPPPPPANDDCTGAITLTVNPDLTCTATTTGTTVSAGNSMDADPCAGTPDDDVFFKFTAIGNSHSIKISNVTAIQGTSTDMYFQVLDGTCGSFTSLLCSDPNDAIVNDLIPGTEYYIRVYSWAATSRQNFTICVATPPLPPANDNCEGAVTLTVNPELTCTATTAGTTLSATNTMEADPCSGNPDDDVFFKFTATSTSHKVTLSNVTAVLGTATDMYFQVLDGTCGNFASLLCSDPNEGIVNGLTPGTEYYVRVYSFAATSRQNFNICITTLPPAPANDDCEGAVSVTVNTDLNCTLTTPGTTLSATNSMDAAPCSGNPDDDVWFSFVAASDSHRISLTGITAVQGTSTDMYFQVLEGVCGGFSSLLCSDAETNNYTGFTPGETYYIRVYSYGATSRQNFNVCIGTPPPPPANDDCEGAITLTVNPDLTCTATTAGTTQSATNTMEAAPCAGNPDDDVFFKFTATATSHRITIANVTAVQGTSTDMYFQVLDGICGSFNSLLCSDNNENVVAGLTIGSEYYVRVYSYGATSRQTFTICVATPPTIPPANDDCEGAIALTVNADLACGATTNATTAAATNYMDAAPCNGNPDDDVFFTFTATAPTHRIVISNVTAVLGTATDMYFQVLTGTCGTFESLLCSDPNDGFVSGLTPGQTYYVRAYTYGANASVNFTICVGTPTTPAPANNECTGAVALTVSPTTTCDAQTAGTTAGATQSMAAAPCAGSPDDDVWYSFVATGVSQTVTLSGITAVAGAGTATDMYFQVLSGACSAPMTSITCSDPNTATVGGLTAGEVYYIRVYSAGATSYNNFNICVTTPPTPPANDDCAAAIALTAGGVFATNPVVVTNVGATASTGAPAPGCAEYAGGDVWYAVEVPASGNITVETGTNTGGSVTDTGLAIYSGTCGTLTLVECDDDDSADGNFSKVALTGRTAGEILYIRTWEYENNSTGSWKISAYDGSLGNQDFVAGSFRHYPNPVKDVLNITSVTDITSVAVFNLLGQQVLAKEVNTTEAAIDMSNLSDGAYIVNVTSGNSVKTIKVVKKQ